ncbi:MAG: 4-(cytidine 5'-diphospho)-2-C-methyl-D-erythritol kinase [Alphaproteobacteria bacterium]|nr:4-(cytidine 5'-diphospho)-2-C-methyl-D-erythritol kinase [Alphaproteobacteria bacterium]
MVTRIFAPAKINLFLHVTDKRPDGYHVLDSLVAFADIGDDILLEPADVFSFHVQGAMVPESDNLVVRAARALEIWSGAHIRAKITLIKNLPVAAGLGGGSADAAATLRGLCSMFSLTVPPEDLQRIALGLGADVPACLQSQPQRMRGIGDWLEPVEHFARIPLVLLHPSVACPTGPVFSALGPDRRPDLPVAAWPRQDDLKSWLEFLIQQENMLTSAAVSLVPEIAQSLAILEQQAGCALTRMSGSGASVFGLFYSDEAAQQAAHSIARAYPRFWVRTAALQASAVSAATPYARAGSC